MGSVFGYDLIVLILSRVWEHPILLLTEKDRSKYEKFQKSQARRVFRFSKVSKLFRRAVHSKLLWTHPFSPYMLILANQPSKAPISSAFSIRDVVRLLATRTSSCFAVTKIIHDICHRGCVFGGNRYVYGRFKQSWRYNAGQIDESVYSIDADRVIMSFASKTHSHFLPNQQRTRAVCWVLEPYGPQELLLYHVELSQPLSWLRIKDVHTHLSWFGFMDEHRLVIACHEYEEFCLRVTLIDLKSNKSTLSQFQVAEFRTFGYRIECRFARFLSLHFHHSFYCSLLGSLLIVFGHKPSDVIFVQVFNLESGEKDQSLSFCGKIELSLVAFPQTRFCVSEKKAEFRVFLQHGPCWFRLEADKEQRKWIVTEEHDFCQEGSGVFAEVLSRTNQIRTGADSLHLKTEGKATMIWDVHPLLYLNDILPPKETTPLPSVWQFLMGNVKLEAKSVFRKSFQQKFAFSKRLKTLLFLLPLIFWNWRMFLILCVSLLMPSKDWSILWMLFMSMFHSQFFVTSFLMLSDVLAICYMCFALGLLSVSDKISQYAYELRKAEQNAIQGLSCCCAWIILGNVGFCEVQNFYGKMLYRVVFLFPYLADRYSQANRRDAQGVFFLVSVYAYIFFFVWLAGFGVFLVLKVFALLTAQHSWLLHSQHFIWTNILFLGLFPCQIWKFFLEPLSYILYMATHEAGESDRFSLLFIVSIVAFLLYGWIMLSGSNAFRMLNEVYINDIENVIKSAFS